MQQYSVHAEVEQIIREVNRTQDQGRKQNNLKLEGVSQVNAESLIIQKKLNHDLNERTNLLSEIEKDH
jgi:hypothetical protein